MSFIPRPALKWANDDRGVAIVSEYVLLLGASMIVFAGIYIGFSSFGNTASADARSAAAYHVAMLVSDRLSDAAVGKASLSESVDIPGRICGSPYLVYPSADGKAICVLVEGDEQEAPILIPSGVRIKGFMVSLPAGHRIDYDAPNKTLSMA